MLRNFWHSAELTLALAFTNKNYIQQEPKIISCFIIKRNWFCVFNNNNNNHNNNNRYLETLPIENYITAFTKTEMHNKQQNLIGKATYTMFEKNEKRRKDWTGKRCVFRSCLNWSVDLAALMKEGMLFHAVDA